MSQSNGGNPRLDRIEKMIEQSERASKEAHARHERAIAEHRRAMAEHRRAVAEHDREIAENRRAWRGVNELVRRFIKLGVKEARDHRRKMREADEKITQLAAAQIVTEEKLQLYLSSLGRSGNGKGKDNKR